MCHEILNCILICCPWKKFRNIPALSGSRLSSPSLVCMTPMLILIVRKYKYEDGVILTGMMHILSFKKIHQLMEKLLQEDTQM
jgi:hypothetical protein